MKTDERHRRSKRARDEWSVRCPPQQSSCITAFVTDDIFVLFLLLVFIMFAMSAASCFGPTREAEKINNTCVIRKKHIYIYIKNCWAAIKILNRITCMSFCS